MGGMTEEKNKNADRVSLLDVLYGVVLGYGFSLTDKPREPLQYLGFALLYLAIIVDWLYVHQRCRKRYRLFALALDVGILFFFSRLLFQSINQGQELWLWLSLLFLSYGIWDSAVQSPCRWESVIGDFVAGGVFALVYADLQHWLNITERFVFLGGTRLDLVPLLGPATIILYTTVYSISFGREISAALTQFRKGPERIATT